MNLSVIEPLEARIAPAAISFSQPVFSENEGNGDNTFLIHVTLAGDDAGRTAPITVHFATSDGTSTTAALNAVSPTDYDATSGTLTFAPGVTAEDISVTVHGNTTVQHDRSFSVDLSNPTGPGAQLATSHATVKILDDDTTVGVANAPSVSEGSAASPGSAVFTITQAAATDHAVTVFYTTANGTAVAGTDYTAKTGSVVIPAGSLTATVTVPLLGNSTVQPDRSFSLQLSSVDGATVDSTHTSGTATILDDDTTVGVGNAPAVAEGSAASPGSAVFTITQAAATDHAVTVHYTTVDGTAKAGTDYTAVTSTVVIPAGSLTATVTVPFIGDSTAEPDRTFSLELTQVDGGAIDPAHSTGTGTIVDDDLPTISVGNTSVLEGNTGDAHHAVFTVTLSSITNHDVTVQYATGDGTGVAGTDYTNSTGTLTIPAGSATGTFSVPVTGNDAVNANKTFGVTLSTPTGGTLSTSTATGTIVDDDGLTLHVSGATTAEGNAGTTSTALFPVALNKTVPAGYALVVNYTATDETATSGKDYVNPGTFTIPGGQTASFLPVSIIGDNVYEGNETFHIDITSAHLVNATDATADTTTVPLPTPASAANGLEAVGTIHDDDPASGVLSVKALAATIPEGSADSHASFIISLSTAYTHDVSLTYTATGVSGTQTLVIPAEQTSITVDVPYTGNTTVGQDQTLTLAITGVTPAVGGFTIKQDPAHSSATTTVLDDDAVVSIDSTFIGTEGTGSAGHTTFNVPVHLSATEDHDVTVYFSTIDGTAVSTGTNPDYVGQINGQVVIKAGQTTADAQVSVTNSSLAGPDGSFQIHLTGDSGAAPIQAGSATSNVTIHNANGEAAVTIGDVTTAEGGTAVFTVHLSKASSHDTTVAYTVNPGSADATRFGMPTTTPGTLTIPAGSTAGTISIPITSDTNADPQAAFTVQLTSATNATLGDHSTAIGTIAGANLPVLSIADATAPEGDPQHPSTEYFTVTLSQPAPAPIVINGQIQPTFYATTISEPGDTAVAGTDYQSFTKMAFDVPEGVSSIQVPVSLLGDTVAQADKTFHLQLSLPDQPTDTTTPSTVLATLAPRFEGKGTIQNDDTQFSIAPAHPDSGTPETVTVPEITSTGGKSVAQFVVTRSGDLSVASTVHYAAIPGTAGTSDFLATSGDLTFAPGVASKTISVPITHDGITESTESFTVALSNPANAVITSGVGVGTVNITDADPIPTVQVTNTTVTETNGNSTMTFIVSLSHANERSAVTVNYSTADGTALAGTDYTAATGSITFQPGQTEVAVPVTIIGNLLQNKAPHETLKLVLSGASPDSEASLPANTFGTGTIVDDEKAPVVSIQPTSVEQGGIEHFTVSLSNGSQEPIKVSYHTVDGTAVSVGSSPDYTGTTNGTITIPAGATTADLTVQTDATALVGPSKAFQVKLTGAAGVPGVGETALPVSINAKTSSATGTILNSTPEIITINDTSVNEGDSGYTDATFTVSLSAASTLPVTVHFATADGTATLNGQDYLPVSGKLVFAPGTTVETINVPVHGDLFQEIGGETFTVNLSSPSNGTLGRAVGTGTIVDDDNSPTLNIQDVYGSEASGKLSFIPTLTSPAASDVTFTLSTGAMAGVAHAATPFVDYVAVPETFTIKAGNTQPFDSTGKIPLTYDVTLINDGVFEPAESFAVKVSNLTNADPNAVQAIIGRGTAEGTILNDDVFVSKHVAKWNDTDGDLVTLTVSKGNLLSVAQSDLFTFTAANALGGVQLTEFNIFAGGQQFLRANINIVATQQPGLPLGIPLGDGLVNVGSIIANNQAGNLLELQGFDLGAVHVDGNLDQIIAGDLFNDAGLASLHVHSFGTGTSGETSVVEEGIGSFKVDGDFSGNLEVIGAAYGYIHNLSIGGALRGTSVAGSAEINLTGALTNAKIGSIVSGSGLDVENTFVTTNTVITASTIGTVKILGNFENDGALPQTALLAANNIHSVTVGGSMIGASLIANNAINSVTVTGSLTSETGGQYGTLNTAIYAGGSISNSALGTVKVGGNVNGAQILAGQILQADSSGDFEEQQLNSNAQIALVQIAGNVQALDIAAGADPGSTTPFSTPAFDSVLSGIAKVIIGGTIVPDIATGGTTPTTHYISAQTIGSIIIGGVSVPVAASGSTPLGGSGTGFVALPVSAI